MHLRSSKSARAGREKVLVQAVGKVLKPIQDTTYALLCKELAVT